MVISPENNIPIYIQIAEGIENDILNGIIKEEESAYSQYQIAKHFSINPATAAKGINLLVQEGILFKKRGLGMFVSKGAVKMIKEKKKKAFFDYTIKSFMQEAKKIGITKEDLKKMIDEYREA